MTETVLRLEDWAHAADADDLALLDLCEGSTIDVGCGPGRLTEALLARGQVAMGVDVTREAVGLANGRGAVAMRRDVFGPLPGEGRWMTALLADGNVGIGGDPVALLERVRRLIDPRGRVVVEVAPPAVPAFTGVATLHQAGQVTRTFGWAVVGLDDIGAFASAAGLGVRTTRRLGERWAVVLEVEA